jgi:hypothetical protein
MASLSAIGGVLAQRNARIYGLIPALAAAGFVATAGFVGAHVFAVGVICIPAIGAATTMHGIRCQTLPRNSTAPGMIGRVLSTWRI